MGRALVKAASRSHHPGATSEMARGLSSAGRAPAWHAGGQRFDPARLHHFPKRPARTAPGLFSWALCSDCGPAARVVVFRRWKASTISSLSRSDGEGDHPQDGGGAASTASATRSAPPSALRLRRSLSWAPARRSKGAVTSPSLREGQPVLSGRPVGQPKGEREERQAATDCGRKILPVAKRWGGGPSAKRTVEGPATLRHRPSVSASRCHLPMPAAQGGAEEIDQLRSFASPFRRCQLPKLEMTDE